MAKKRKPGGKKAGRPIESPPFGIYAAERASGPENAVLRGDSPLGDAVAVSRLLRGEDVVVCGPDGRANRREAERIGNAAFGSCDPDGPHDSKGRTRALAHFHPAEGEIEVHIFYEQPPRRHASRRGP